MRVPGGTAMTSSRARRPWHEEFLTTYRPIVRRMLRRQLDKFILYVQRLYDLNDAEQSFWISVLPRVFAEEFLQHLESDPEYLVSFLRAKSHDKAIEIQRRFFECQMRDMRRQRGLETVPPSIESAGADTDPVALAMAHETWDKLLSKISPNGILRKALVLLRVGHNVSDVAEKIGVPRSSLRRLLQPLSKIIEV
jgi:hypothetical protein